MRIRKTAPIVMKTHGPKHHFFGYFDKTPWNKSGSRILFIEADFQDRLPMAEDAAVIGYLSTTDYEGKTRNVAETTAWNWQQGCMLQWLPASEEDSIIYNDRRDGRLVSILMNIKNGTATTIPAPVYSVHPNGESALSLNFARLHSTRTGYGYEGLADPFHAEAAPSDDGVYCVDFRTGATELLISLEALRNINHVSTMDHGKHWVDHITYNTDGSRFCFLHRWELPEGKMYTRVYTVGRDGKDLFCILDSGMFSHFSWYDEQSLVGWGRLPSIAGDLRKHRWLNNKILERLLPIYHLLFDHHKSIKKRVANDSYLWMVDRTCSNEKVGVKVLDEDGHCSWSPDRDWIVTDTYPDKNNFRHLILYHYKKGHRIDIGSFFSPSGHTGPIRCDLHPRWNRDGTQVCIDSVHEGSRQMYIIDLRKIIKDNAN